VKTSWTKGLNATESEDLKGNFKGAAITRNRLADLLLSKISLSQTNASSKLLYDNPNWALLQADQRGYERALHEIVDLMSEK
jgi:hypothetical protein